MAQIMQSDHRQFISLYYISHYSQGLQEYQEDGVEGGVEGVEDAVGDTVV